MVQLNLGPNVAAEESGCPEEHTGTKCETWRTMCAGRVAYTDPGPSKLLNSTEANASVLKVAVQTLCKNYTVAGIVGVPLIGTSTARRAP